MDDALSLEALKLNLVKVLTSPSPLSFFSFSFSF